MKNSHSKIQSHRDLVVWQKGIELVSEIYRITDLFPRDERYRLTDQMRRAAISIPANIAEGRAREGSLDYVRFVGISRGSTAELDTYLEITKRCGYVAPEQLEPSWSRVDHVTAMLINLQRSVRLSSGQRGLRA